MEFINKIKIWWKQYWCGHSSVTSMNNGPFICDKCGKDATLEWNERIEEEVWKKHDKLKSKYSDLYDD